jgi:hypothetical protein
MSSLTESLRRNSQQGTFSGLPMPYRCNAYTFGKPGLADVQHGYDDSLAFYKGLFNGTLEVWVTETGKPIEDENSADAVTRYLNDALSYFDRTVSNVFWFSLHDNMNESRFGLIENVTNPRPA